MSTSEIDAARAEEFAGKLLGYLNGGALSLMISAGYQAGLFETMAALPAATSVEIAGAAGAAVGAATAGSSGVTRGRSKSGFSRTSTNATARPTTAKRIRKRRTRLKAVMRFFCMPPGKRGG